MIAMFWLGSFVAKRSGLRHAQIDLDSTQAMLGFNRILEERQLALFLSKGCSAQALEEIKIQVDQNKKLLASFTKEKLSPWVIKYINERDPALLKELVDFKSKYGTSWMEPQCAR